MMIDTKAVTHRRLVLAKAMYEHGLSSAKNAGALAKMIAVHSFHNAVEITLRAIALHHGIALPQPAASVGFATLVQEIDRRSKSGGPGVPLRQQIDGLNTKRNMVQHDAHEPEAAMMEEWRVLTLAFLKQAFRDFFQVEFDDVSRVSLVADESLRGVLARATDELGAARWSRALALSKIAIEAAMRSLRHIAFPRQRRVGHEIRLTARDHDHAAIVHGVSRAVSDLAAVVNENAKLLVLLASGIDLIAWTRFDAAPVTVSRAMSGKIYTRTAGDVSEADARWAHDFAVDALIRWQSAGLSPGGDEGLCREVEQWLSAGRSDEPEIGGAAAVPVT